MINTPKTKATIGRWLTGLSSVRYLAQSYLLVRTFFMRRNKPVMAVLSLGEIMHAYSAARGVSGLGRRVLLITDTPQLPEMAYTTALLRRNPLTEADAIMAELEDFNLEAVLVSTDHDLLPIQDQIANRFNLISVGAKSAVLNNDKLAWRDALAAKGVPQPAYSADPAVFEGKACIRKPCYGGGSDGVVALEPEADKTAYSGPDYFFESMIDGDQYDYEGVVDDGKPRFLARVYENYRQVNGTFVQHYYFFNPPLNPARNAALEECVRKTLDASEIKSGAFHVEMRMNGDHAEPIDFANRIGAYERCVTFASGVDFGQAHANCFLRAKHQLNNDEPRAVLQYFCWSQDEFDRATAIQDANPDRVFDARMSSHDICGEECYGMITFFHDDYEKLLRMTESLEIAPR